MSTPSWLMATLRRFALCAICCVQACATSSAQGEPAPDLVITRAPVSYEVVTGDHASDPTIDALVLPYRERLQAEAGRVIGVATAAFTEDQPEGTLGNLVADAILHVIQDLVEDTVHVAVMNNGGLRVPIRPGPITVGEIMEVAPFDNYLAVLELSGSQLQTAANEIAAVGGEPVAGLSFHIDVASNTAQDLRIGGVPVTRDGTYRLVTVDYLIDGGGFMRSLWSMPRVTTNVLLRDAIVSYIEQRGEISPRLEDRIILVMR